MCFYFLFFINECEGTECDFLVLILAANLWTVAAGGRFLDGAPHPTILTYTILPKYWVTPLLMNRFDYFSNFHEYNV